MTTLSQFIRPQFARIQRIALIVGGVALLICLIFAFVSGTQFFQSYLYAFIFWVGLSLGSLIWLMIQHLTGGRWPVPTRRIFEAGAMTIPVMGILFIPLFFGLAALYPWARPGAANDPIIAAKLPYLTSWFFIIRQILYFAIWTTLAIVLNRASARLDAQDDPALRHRMEWISGPGVVIYVLTMTFAAIDWGMSLEPEFYSSMYAVIYMIGQGLNALAFVAIVLHLLRDREPLTNYATVSRFHDIGSLTFALIVFWTYTSFSQYLIVWSSNTTELAPWYYVRGHNGWQYFAIVLIAFQFFMPFFILLSRKVKRNSRYLATVAGFIMFMRLVDIFWVIKPSFHPEGVYIHPLDVIALLGMGGIWIAAFLWALGSKRLVPNNVPAVQQMQQQAAHGHH